MQPRISTAGTGGRDAVQRPMTGLGVRHVCAVQEGHPEAGVAYSGNIPHEFLNHLLDHEGGELLAGGAAGTGLGVGVKGPGRKAAHNDEL